MHGLFSGNKIRDGFHSIVHRFQRNKDYNATFVELLNILCKLAQFYYANATYNAIAIGL